MELIQSLANSEIEAALATFVIAMMPVLELRGALPIGVALGLPLWAAFVISFLGNLVPVPFIVLFIRRLLEWLRPKSRLLSRFVSWLERHAEGKWEKVQGMRFIGLLILVAIPLPGTGAWTGALVAGLLDMRLKNAIIAILLGVLIAGIIVLGVTYGFTSIA